MPEAWRKCTLGDVVTLKRGYDLPHADRRPGPIPIVSSSGPSGWHDVAKAKAPGVVTGRYGTIGEVFYIQQDYWPLNTALYVKDFKGNNPRFISYLLQTLRFDAYSDKSSVPGLNRNHLHRYEVVIPDLPEQQEIAEVLGALDDAVEQNRGTIRVLERLIRAVFRAWFVEFEPVKAKAAGATEFPSMPEAIFDAIPDSLINSELGTIPRGWGVESLGDQCKINQSTIHKAEIEGEIEYIDISSVTVGHLEKVQRVPFFDAPSRARRRVCHGDTIWSCVRPNHRSYLFIHTPPGNRVVSTGFAVLSPARFGPAYLHELTIQQEFVDYLVANADGSAYPAVRPEHFAAARVVVPPEALIQAFEKVTMPLRDLIEMTEQETGKLATMRDYLLPRLLSGEVRVRDAMAMAARSA